VRHVVEMLHELWPWRTAAASAWRRSPDGTSRPRATRSELCCKPVAVAGITFVLKNLASSAFREPDQQILGAVIQYWQLRDLDATTSKLETFAATKSIQFTKYA
jgi:hypothetical protein